MLVLLTLLHIFFGSVTTEGLPPFAILKPSKFRLGHQGKVTILLFQKVEGNVSLTYYNKTVQYYPTRLEKQETLDETSKVISKEDKLIDLTFQLPEYNHGSHYAKLKLEIKSFGSYEYDLSGFGVESSGYKTFVQTDKPVYKPGEMIRYRTFTVDIELRAVKEVKGLEVSINLPNGVQMFKETVTSDDGIVHQGQFLLAEEATLGDYSISVRGKDTALCGFNVEEYILPKFGIEINGPGHINPDDTTISGTVTATYTYGRAVDGKLKMTFAVDSRKQSSYSGSYIVHEIAMDIVDGKAEWEIGTDAITKKVKFLFNPFCEPTKLIITANVTDDAKGFNVKKRDDSTTFVQSSYKLSFSKDTQQTYVAGLPYYVELDVKSLTVNSTDVENMKMKITAIYNVKNPIYDYEIVQIVEGKAYVVFNIPEDTCSVKITAEIDLDSSCESIFTCYQPERVVSKNKDFVRFNKLAPKIYNVGETAYFDIIAKSVLIDELHYVVISKGQMVDSGTVNGSWTNNAKDDQTATQFSLLITKELNTRSRIMVFSVSSKTGYILADAADICIKEVLENSVVMKFSKDVGEPGDNVTLYFDTAPDTFIGISVTDASLNLLKKPCKSLSKEGALEFGRGLDRGVRKDLSCKRDDPYQCTSTTEIKITDAGRIIEAQGVNIQTNVKVFKYIAPRKNDGYMYKGSKGYPGPDYNYEYDKSIDGAGGYEGNEAAEGRPVEPDDEGDISDSSPRTRNVFPEAWLWTDVVSNNDGTYEITATIPDTITGWIGSAFGLSPTKGLGFSNEVNFKTFLPFFISLDLPYSGTVGERIKIKVRVFSYLKQDTSATVKITSVMWDTVEKTIKVKNNTATTIDYTISLIRAGRYSITVVATATADISDAITKSLLVKPGGEKITQSHNVLIMERKSRKEVFYVKLPKSYISGSHSLKFVAIGDFLGEAVTGISNLIQLPSGCGEQNMHKIAINVYSANYIKQVYGMFQPHIKYNIDHNLNIGLQQQMAYRPISGGGYSVFKGGEVSIWLTAFAYRIFSQYPQTQYFPCNVMDSDRSYLIYKQDYKYGSSVSNIKQTGWAPAQYTLHKNSQMYLNAYYIIALLEGEGNNRCKKDLSKSSYYRGRVERVCNQTVLDYPLSDVDCCYDHMVRYAMGLCSDRLPNFQSYLDTPDNCITTPRNKQYQYVKCQADSDIKASSKQIEATSYAALYLIRKKEAKSCLPLILWLASQRNENGGYRSSQDTVLGIQALAEYAKVMGVGSVGKTDMRITVEKDKTRVTLIEINEDNKLSTQEVIMTPAVGAYKVKWSGKGIAFVQLISTYHIGSNKYKPIYKLAAKLIELDEGGLGYLGVSFTLPSETGTMYMLDIASVTGIIFTKALIEGEMQSTESDYNQITRYDVTDGGQRLLMYIDPSTKKTAFSLSVPFSKKFDVMKRAPAQITLVDYYNPSQRETIFYKIASDRDNTDSGPTCNTLINCDILKNSEAILIGYPGKSTSETLQVTSAFSYKKCGAAFIVASEAMLSWSNKVTEECLKGMDNVRMIYLLTYRADGMMMVDAMARYSDAVDSIRRCYKETSKCPKM